MITTTYTCDHCEQETKRDDLYNVTLSAKPLYQSGSYDFSLSPNCGPAHWCNKCIRASGWFAQNKNKPAEVDNPPAATIEDLIVQLVESTVANLS